MNFYEQKVYKWVSFSQIKNKYSVQTKIKYRYNQQETQNANRQHPPGLLSLLTTVRLAGADVTAAAVKAALVLSGNGWRRLSTIILGLKSTAGCAAFNGWDNEAAKFGVWLVTKKTKINKITVIEKYIHKI